MDWQNFNYIEYGFNKHKTKQNEFMNTTIICFFVVFIFLGPAVGHADVYRYVDSSGVVYFSNVKHNNKYRLYMKEESSLVSRSPFEERNKYNQLDPIENAKEDIYEKERRVGMSSSGIEGFIVLAICLAFLIVLSVFYTKNATEGMTPEQKARWRDEEDKFWTLISAIDDSKRNY